MLPPLAFINLGPWEIAIIVFLALLLFGGKRLPSLAKDLGSGIKEFRKSLSGASEDESTNTSSNSIDELSNENSKSESSKKSKKKKV
jgi:sec-independent protein translocase protein TatA